MDDSQYAAPLATAAENEAIRCSLCDQPVPDHGDLHSLSIRVAENEVIQAEGLMTLRRAIHCFPRPWIDGDVTFQEWLLAGAVIIAAIARDEERD